MHTLKQPALDSFDVKNASHMFFKRNRAKKQTSLMWILRASTQSSQAEVQGAYRSRSPSLRAQEVLHLISEVLDEGVEVPFGKEGQIP